MLIPDVVGPLEQIRDPADLALCVHQTQSGELLQLAGEQEVGERVHAVAEADGHGHAERRVRRRRRHLRPRADVEAHHGVPSVARGEERIPIAAVDARQTEVRRDLAERDRAHTTRGVALDLVGGERRIPQRHEAQRDQSTAAGPAPLFDHPVVVGLDAEQREARGRWLRGTSGRRTVGNSESRATPPSSCGPCRGGARRGRSSRAACRRRWCRSSSCRRGPTGRGDRSFQRLVEVLVHPVVDERTVGAGPLDVARARQPSSPAGSRTTCGPTSR